MTKKADKSLSSLFFLVVGLLAVILYNNLKEDRVLQEVTEDTPSEEIPVSGVICFIIDDFGYNLSNEVRGFIDLDIPITC